MTPTPTPTPTPEDTTLLRGATCPTCGGAMPPGSIRFRGDAWEHRDPDAHPQAGHHRFDPADLDWVTADERTHRRVECRECGWCVVVTGQNCPERSTPQRNATNRRAGHISAGCPADAVDVEIVPQFQLTDYGTDLG